jgi:hypothetical protein
VSDLSVSPLLGVKSGIYSLFLSSRKDPDIVRSKSFQKAFLTGSNTTCRGHIRQHYEYYSKRCKEAGIEESERCVPPEILRARKSKSSVLVQTKLSVAVGGEPPPKQFTREGTVRSVTKFVACDDQVSALSFDFTGISVDIMCYYRPLKSQINPHFGTASLP